MLRFSHDYFLSWISLFKNVINTMFFLELDIAFFNELRAFILPFSNLFRFFGGIYTAFIKNILPFLPRTNLTLIISLLLFQFVLIIIPVLVKFFGIKRTVLILIISNLINECLQFAPPRPSTRPYPLPF